MTLYFKDKTSAKCDILGSIEEDGKRYAVFLCKTNKNLYVYKYKRKKNKCKLIPIKNKEEFRKVCIHLNGLIGESSQLPKAKAPGFEKAECEPLRKR